MPQQNTNSQTTSKPPLSSFNQANQQSPPKQSLTEERIKEVITETLIELDLIPKTKKKKAITIE